ncbi:MAG: hypothetical protein ACYCOU_25180 [Sulfobacillus sp.]
MTTGLADTLQLLGSIATRYNGSNSATPTNLVTSAKIPYFASWMYSILLGYHRNNAGIQQAVVNPEGEPSYHVNAKDNRAFDVVPLHDVMTRVFASAGATNNSYAPLLKIINQDTKNEEGLEVLLYKAVGESGISRGFGAAAPLGNTTTATTTTTTTTTGQPGVITFERIRRDAPDADIKRYAIEKLGIKDDSSRMLNILAMRPSVRATLKGFDPALLSARCTVQRILTAFVLTSHNIVEAYRSMPIVRDFNLINCIDS